MSGPGGTPPSIGHRALADLQTAAHHAHLESSLSLVRAGRGRPAQIRAITQALIDAGGLPKEIADYPSAIRVMMFQHGIGVDCAGYVQQAYLRATGLDRARARLGPVGDEDLSHLDRRGYRRIAAWADVRAGDLVVLGGGPASSANPHPVGHRAVVYDQRRATAADILQLLQTHGADAFAVGGPMRVFEVDSSWGCGGVALVGGVQRECWWYNESTHAWGWQGQGDGHSLRPFFVSSTPHGHPFDPPANGFFRDPRRAP